MAYQYSNYRGRTPLWKKLAAVVLILIILLSAGFLFIQKYMIYDDAGQVRIEFPWMEQEQSAEAESGKKGEAELIIQAPEEEPVFVRGVLLGEDSSLWQETVGALDEEETAFAITVKSTGGRLHYLSALEGVFPAENAAEEDAVLRELVAEDRYAAARLSCFRDRLRANADLDNAGLKNTGGYIFYDGNNENWMDPGKEGAREYLCGIAAECAALGFDEILLTDLSYPTTGKLDKMDYGEADRCGAILRLLEEMRAVLPEDVSLTVELPVTVIEVGGDEIAGLDLEQVVALVDAVYAVTEPEAVAGLTEKLAELNCVFIPQLVTVPEDMQGNYLRIS